MNNAILIIVAMITALVGALFLSFLLSYPAYLLWNGCLVGAITGVQSVTWLQMWGISFLSAILFKNNEVSK